MILLNFDQITKNLLYFSSIAVSYISIYPMYQLYSYNFQNIDNIENKSIFFHLLLIKLISISIKIKK